MSWWNWNRITGNLRTKKAACSRAKWWSRQKGWQNIIHFHQQLSNWTIVCPSQNTIWQMKCGNVDWKFENFLMCRQELYRRLYGREETPPRKKFCVAYVNGNLVTISAATTFYDDISFKLYYFLSRLIVCKCKMVLLFGKVLIGDRCGNNFSDDYNL